MPYLRMSLSDARVEVVVITVFNYAVAQRAVAQCAVAQRASQQSKGNTKPDKSQKQAKPTEVDQAMCKSNATNTSKFSRRSKHTRKNKGNY